MTIFAKLQGRIARRSNAITWLETALVAKRKSMKTYAQAVTIAEELKSLRADQVLDNRALHEVIGEFIQTGTACDHA
jgi:hypothetical protein